MKTIVIIGKKNKSKLSLKIFKHIGLESRDNVLLMVIWKKFLKNLTSLIYSFKCEEINKRITFILWEWPGN